MPSPSASLATAARTRHTGPAQAFGWREAATAWLTLLLCVLVLVMLQLAPDSAIALKILVDPILHATSNIAVILLVASIAIAAAAVALRRQSAHVAARLERLTHSRGRLARAAMFAGIAIGCVVAMWLQLRVLALLELPWNTRIRLFDADANTVSSVLHNHMGKTALAFVFRDALPHASGYDAGHALDRYSPSSVSLALALAFTLACAGAWWCWLQTLARLPVCASDGERRTRILWLALHASCLVGCLKAVIDGGMLHYGFASWLLTLRMAMRAGQPDAMFAKRWHWLLVMALSGAALYAVWAVASRSTIHAFFLSWSPPVAFLAVLVFAMQPTASDTTSGESTGPRFGRRAVLALAVGWLILNWAFAAERGVGRLLAPVAPGAIVTLGAPPNRRVHQQPTLAAALRALGEDPLKPRQTLLVTAGRAPGGSARLFLVIVPRDALWRDPALSLTSLERQGYDAALAPAGDNRFLLRLLPRSPLPGFAVAPDFAAARNAQVHLHRLAAALQHGGLVHFALVAIADTDGLAS